MITMTVMERWKCSRSLRFCCVVVVVVALSVDAVYFDIPTIYPMNNRYDIWYWDDFVSIGIDDDDDDMVECCCCWW